MMTTMIDGRTIARLYLFLSRLFFVVFLFATFLRHLTLTRGTSRQVYQREDKMATKIQHCRHGCRNAFVTRLVNFFNKEKASNSLKIALNR